MNFTKTIFVIILFAVFLFGSSSVRAQKNDSLFLRREVRLGEEVYGYRVYVPKNRKPKTKLPVMLYLHGNAANGTDNEKQIESFVDFIGSKPKLFNFIIVFPQARPESFWINEETEQAIKALDQTIAEFNGDAQRLYLAGHSLGGYGTYTTAVLYPNKFAALVPVAGGIVPPNELSPIMKLFIPKPLLEILNAANPYDALVEKLGDAHLWIFHGAADESISVKESRNIAAALKKNGSKNFKYTEYAETDHNDAFVKAFSDPKLYKWLGKQKLKGLAWHILSASSGNIVRHNGGSGGFRSFAGVNGVRRKGIVVLSNTNESVDDIGFHSLDEKIPLGKTKPFVAVSEKTLNEYVGDYGFAPGVFLTVTRRGGKLFAQLTGQSSLRVFASAENEFYYRVVDARLTSNHAAGDGKIESVTLHQNGDQTARRVK